ncbi:MAG: YtxH domain-containing protein [Candidatus Fermentibacteraceae bacterium]|nr:YtxH domain-containing protein [Candidatus Fermentibacteraceae bacterium]MBN2608743.1 YtxH domain-containing protein [Candidatus Fermentibacteraceae bacterium]
MAENGKGEFWAFVAGTLAGGILALLYAPAKGEETREKVRATTGELYGKGEEFYRHFRTEAEKLISDGKKMIDGAGAAGREKIEETIQKLEETREKLEEVKEKGREKIEVLKEKVEKRVKKPASSSAGE